MKKLSNYEALLALACLFLVLSPSVAIPVLDTVDQWADPAVDAVQVSAKRSSCCVFPETDWGADVTVSPENGLENKGSQGLSFTFTAGGIVTANLASPTMVFKCGSGKTIKAASDMCGALPINDNSQGWNAIGFEGTPALTVGLFGLEFDVLGEIRSWDNTTEADKDKVKTTQQKIGAAAKSIHNGDSKGVCAAYQLGLFPAGCGGGFAMAQNGFLKASCGLNPAGTVIICPALPKSPSVTLELLNFGLSPNRDLEQEAFIGFWNGDKSIKEMVLESERFTSKGVLTMMGSISFTAFEFKIFGENFEVGATITGAMTLDIRLPSLSQIKTAFLLLASGKFDQLFGPAGANALPGFQFTISGEVTVSCDLKLFELEFSPGSAGVTFGFNMGSDYKGFSNGLYMAAQYQVTLLDLVPPLSNPFFECGGKNIFANVSFKRAAGLYMSLSKGLGFGIMFELKIFGFSTGASLLITTNKAQFSWHIGCTIGGYHLGAELKMGFSFSRSGISPYLDGKFPSRQDIVNAAAAGLKSIWGSLLNMVKGWVGLGQQEFLQWKVQEDQKLQSLLQSSAHVDSAARNSGAPPRNADSDRRTASTRHLLSTQAGLEEDSNCYEKTFVDDEACGKLCGNGELSAYPTCYVVEFGKASADSLAKFSRFEGNVTWDAVNDDSVTKHKCCKKGPTCIHFETALDCSASCRAHGGRCHEHKCCDIRYDSPESSNSALDDVQVASEERSRWGGGRRRRRRRRWHRWHIHHRHHRHHWHHRHHRHHWHHRHHRHHWHHRHHRYHLHHRHRPHFHAAALWEAAKPKLIFNVKSSEFELNICGFKLDFSVEAGASLWGLTAKKTFGIKININPGDILQKIKDAVLSGFNAVKNSISSLVGQYLQEEYYEQQEELLLQIEKRTGKKYIKAKGKFSAEPLRRTSRTQH